MPDHLLKTLRLTLHALALLYALGLYGCAPDGAVLQDELLAAPEAGGWFYTDTLETSFIFEGPPGVYALGIQMETTDEYPYRNLHLMHCLAEGQSPCQLARSNFYLQNTEGKWHGKETFSGNYTLYLELEENAQLKSGKSYRFRLTQDMRADTLAGVSKVQLIIKKP